MVETMMLASGYDKRKFPEMLPYRNMTREEILRTHGKTVQMISLNGTVRNVKVTSIKTWKTRPDVEIGCKYGMYEFFTLSLTEALAKMVTPC